MIDVVSQSYPLAERRESPWLIEARALVRLAAPLAVTQLAQMAVLTTDVVLLGRLSTHALAAAAVGNVVYYFAWLLGSGPAMAVSPMIAQLLGARPRDRAGVRAIVRMGLWAAVLLSGPLIGLMLFAEPILLRLGQTPQLSADAGVFVAMLCFGLPFALGFNVLRNFATSVGRPNAPLWVMLSSIVWNLVVGWALIFGHLGAPKLGIMGAGIATASSAAYAFVLLLVLILVRPELKAYRILRRFGRPHWPQFVELFRLGVPIGVTLLFEAMLFNSMTLVVGTFGEAQLAAHQIALNFASVTFMVPLGVAMAATVRVGLAAGAGDLAGARRAGLTAMAMAMGFISLCALLMAVAGEQIASLYVPAGGENAEVIRLAALFLLVAAVFQVFDAAQVVGALSLRGLKDARWPMILAGGSYWLAGAPVCVALGVGLGMQGLGVWIGLAFGLAVAALAMLTRFHLLTRPT
jgi:multidrug resistance protein, MATE family